MDFMDLMRWNPLVLVGKTKAVIRADDLLQVETQSEYLYLSSRLHSSPLLSSLHTLLCIGGLDIGYNVHFRCFKIENNKAACKSSAWVNIEHPWWETWKLRIERII